MQSQGVVHAAFDQAHVLQRMHFVSARCTAADIQQKEALTTARVSGMFQLRQDAQQLLPGPSRGLPGSCGEAIEGAALGLQREGPLLAMA